MLCLLVGMLLAPSGPIDSRPAQTSTKDDGVGTSLATLRDDDSVSKSVTGGEEETIAL